MKNKIIITSLIFMALIGMASCGSSSTSYTAKKEPSAVEIDEENKNIEDTDNSQESKNGALKESSLYGGFLTATLPDSWNHEESTDSILVVYPSGNANDREVFSAFYGDLESNYNDAEIEEQLKTIGEQSINSQTEDGAIVPDFKEYEQEVISLGNYEKVLKQTYVQDYTSAGYDVTLRSEEYLFPVNNDGLLGIGFFSHQYDANEDPKYEDEFINTFLSGITLNGNSLISIGQAANDETKNEEPKNESDDYVTKVEKFDCETYSESQLYYEAIVSIKNTSKSNMALDSCVFDIEDVNGHLVSTDLAYATVPELLKPGETAYFIGSGHINSSSVDEEFKVVPKPVITYTSAEIVDNPLLDVSITENALGTVSILGRVSNELSVDQYYIAIGAVLLDQDGNVVDVTYNAVERTDPNNPISFELPFLNGKMDDVDEYFVYSRVLK